MNIQDSCEEIEDLGGLSCVNVSSNKSKYFAFGKLDELCCCWWLDILEVHIRDSENQMGFICGTYKVTKVL